MRQTVLDFSLISNRIVAVIHSSLPVSLVVSILTTILGSVLGLIEPLTMFVSVDEIALIGSMRLGEYSYIEINLPLPWNLLFSLKVPL